MNGEITMEFEDSGKGSMNAMHREDGHDEQS